MTVSDVVAALDYWAAEVEADGTTGPARILIMQARCARAEIMKLRREHDPILGADHIERIARNKALDDAAREAERWAYSGGDIAAAIRAMKDKRDE